MNLEKLPPLSGYFPTQIYYLADFSTEAMARFPEGFFEPIFRKCQAFKVTLMGSCIMEQNTRAYENTPTDGRKDFLVTAKNYARRSSVRLLLLTDHGFARWYRAWMRRIESEI